ncbi:MAG: hypothetical protein KBG28_05665 [Kofleriaceae bacterium]|nr:hypothetical protein [Kofleriaceae bacterium]
MASPSHRWLAAALATTLGVTSSGCIKRIKRSVSTQLATVDKQAAFLKAHMRDGEVYVLRSWKVGQPPTTLTGTGERLGADRTSLGQGTFTLALADVALFESNVVETSPAVAALTIITGISLVVTVACVTNPKACFGSCPTFYAPADADADADAGAEVVLQAEGFSDSISPALEATDVDALWRTRGRGGPLVVRMTNEAYETHVVKQADLLAVPITPGQRVVADGAGLWRTGAVHVARACVDSDGADCAPALTAVDGRERLSLTDPRDLATRETLTLELPAPMAAAGGPAPARGVVVAARQSLVTTFLMYQGLAYLGRAAGGWLALLERGDQTAAGNGARLRAALGGIEVQVPAPDQPDGWRTVGEVYETGPLATDVHLIRLPAGVDGARVRLRLPRGGWRIDHVGLVDVLGQATPVRLRPQRVVGSISPTFAPTRAPATGFPLVTQPGDEYLLTYQVPAGEHALLLESRGYYLEWMRTEWLREHAPLQALRMLADPERALRELAPAFKAIEPEAEAMFWRSRYARP